MFKLDMILNMIIILIYFDLGMYGQKGDQGVPGLDGLPGIKGNKTINE